MLHSKVNKMTNTLANNPITNFIEIKALVNGKAWVDHSKFTEKNNKAAATRFRKYLLQVGKFTHEGRKEIQERKNGMITASKDDGGDAETIDDQTIDQTIDTETINADTIDTDTIDTDTIDTAIIDAGSATFNEESAIKNFIEIHTIVNGDASIDHDKFIIKNNKTAATRLRAYLLNIGRLCHDGRKEVLERRNSLPTNTVSGDSNDKKSAVSQTKKTTAKKETTKKTAAVKKETTTKKTATKKNATKKAVSKKAKA
jgi:hypothetical protein